MAMSKKYIVALVLLTFTCLVGLLCCYFVISSSSRASSHGFLGCLSDKGIPVFPQGSDSFMPRLNAYIRNPRFLANTTVRPLYMVMPTNAGHVQDAVRCGSRHNMSIRVRSGGHDYEGLSYRSVNTSDFAVLDLSELRAVLVDNQTSTAWVESGATLGELYYAIGNASDVLGFPGGVCPTVGVGGHFSGGGFGTLMRKHGLAVDNVIDAELVVANGTVLNRTTMGEDVFWAIRGGGGSFGVVLKWQVRLVTIPATVSVFKESVLDRQRAVDKVTKWQRVAPDLPGELYIRVSVKEKEADFRALFLGGCDDLRRVMNSSLGLTSTDCKEMTWVESVAYIWLGSNSTREDLLNRNTSVLESTNGFKATTDYVRQAIPQDVWTEIFRKLVQPEAQIILVPYGGQMGNVSEDATPFPHRKGVLYSMQLYNYWPVDSADGGAAEIEWVRDMHQFMTTNVSSNPREAYFGCRDLDLGDHWGRKYFKDNYQRLTEVKAMVDPDDYFRSEQSIPPNYVHQLQRPGALSSAF